MTNNRNLHLSLLFLMALTLLSVPSAAQIYRNDLTSDLLLPYFEVDLDGSLTTLFSVNNALDEPVDLSMTVYSNWGTEILRIRHRLERHEVMPINLRDWIASGRLPDGERLDLVRREHVQAALSGHRSPMTDMFYSTEIERDRAVGYVILRTTGNPRPKALWGEYFIVDPANDYAQGDSLISIDPTSSCPGVCNRHALRYMVGGAFSGGTELIIWTSLAAGPQASTNFPDGSRVSSESSIYDEAGNHVEDRPLDLLPLQVINLEDLGLSNPFGWLDIVTSEPSFIAVRYSAEHRFSVGLQSTCLPVVFQPDQPKIRIEKLTNGEDADVAPGPEIDTGSAVTWEYVVSNAGDLTLSEIQVNDDQGVEVTCPTDTLEPGEQMVCTGSGTAESCQYKNVGNVIGRASNEQLVTDSDPSHYFGSDGVIALVVETSVNGQAADEPNGPKVKPGTALEWTYEVANSGEVDLMAISVTDDLGLAIDCPKDALGVGQSMICTASSTAEPGQHKNVGFATGQPKTSCGGPANASDPAHYFGQDDPLPPAIDIEKATNGHDADAPTGPQIDVGDPVTWTYRVTNTGQLDLTAVTVTDDDPSVTPSCPKSSLAVGESMTCTAHGTATAGQYANLGTASGDSSEGPVDDSDPSHYFGRETLVPSIDIEKATNGHDADAPTGPQIDVGDPVTWTYRVTNTGQLDLTAVTVTDDDPSVTPSCPKSSLAVGESMTCTAHGTATAGQYANLGTASGDSSEGPVDDSDPSHYFGRETLVPSIDIEKATNGHDADAPTGPQIDVGDPVTWTYRVTNTGQLDLTAVTVTDDDPSVTPSCPKSSLAVGESMTCTAHGTATAGQYANLGTASGDSSEGPVGDSDPSHYFGKEPPTGGQGCTPGYWKNHTDSWPPTGYSPGQSVQSVFAQAAAYPGIGSATLHQALDFSGGSGIEGAARNLLRAAVASLLNSSHSGVAFPRTTSQVLSQVDAALASADRATMLDLAAALDADNNGGCPLN